MCAPYLRELLQAVDVEERVLLSTVDTLDAAAERGHGPCGEARAAEQ